MKKYEYKITSIDAKGIFGGKVDLTNAEALLNEMGSAGWELVESVSSNKEAGSTRYLICMFKREAE